MKDKIRTAALAVFDEKGYLSAGIRDIAAAAGCSLPLLYRHYGNKEKLYETIVCEAYEDIKIADKVPANASIVDHWFFRIMQIDILSPDERRALRLADNVLAGLGNAPSEAAARLKKAFNLQQFREKALLTAECTDKNAVRLALRAANALFRAVLFETESLTQKEVRAELELLFGVLRTTR